MKYLALATLTLVFLAGCQECPGGPILTVDRIGQPSTDPVTLDAEHVQAESPRFHALLEEAYETRSASTQSQKDRDAVSEYFQSIGLGPELGPVQVEYRGKFFSIGEQVC